MSKSKITSRSYRQRPAKKAAQTGARKLAMAIRASFASSSKHAAPPLLEQTVVEIGQYPDGTFLVETLDGSVTLCFPQPGTALPATSP